MSRMYWPYKMIVISKRYSFFKLSSFWVPMNPINRYQSTIYSIYLAHDHCTALWHHTTSLWIELWLNFNHVFLLPSKKYLIQGIIKAFSHSDNDVFGMRAPDINISIFSVTSAWSLISQNQVLVISCIFYIAENWRKCDYIRSYGIAAWVQ